MSRHHSSRRRLRLGIAVAMALVATTVGTGFAGAAAATPSWTIQSTPNPAGAQSSELLGVSCTSATACTAVGEYRNSSGTELALAERWNGTRWSIQPTASPTSAAASVLLGVSCTLAIACTAVGGYINSSGSTVTLAESWNGIRWTIQPTPNPTGAPDSVLLGVSCTSVIGCTAVGQYSDSSGTTFTLAERWNGIRWAIQPTPNPTTAIGSELLGVSCTSPTTCTAVGDAGTTVSLAERWNGARWTIQPTPNPVGAQASELLGVSCNSATACAAVGVYVNASGTELTLAERWNGTLWIVQPTPNPSAALGSALVGVSCTSATVCTAVGVSVNASSTSVTLAEAGNNASWTLKSTPNPAGAQNSELRAVSCTSATACIAVGFHGGTSVTILAERFA